MIINQELARTKARGYGDGLNSGMVIGLPPVMNFGKEPLRSKVLEEVFSGQKVSDRCYNIATADIADYQFGHIRGICWI